MPIRCPYCSYEMGLKGAKPGRFNPHCPSCAEKFSLLIPDDPSMPPRVFKTPDTSGETLTPAVAHALGIEGPTVAVPVPASPPGYVQTAAPAPAVGLSSAAVDIPAAPQAQVAVRVQQSIAKTPATDNDQPLTGRLGGYDIIGKLGQGGMGAVYLARQLSLDRNVALKVLSAALASDPQFVVRFIREAYAAAHLTHHNIVQIHDIGAQRDIHYFSMELVQGQNLADSVNEHGKLDPDAAAGYVLQAARGLKFAHDHGMIHRDIKPENLLLNESGVVKIADLGLVKRANSQGDTQITGVSSAAESTDQTQMNMSMGTPAYMAPEQARDASQVDQRADIYSLGCTLYDLLTGQPPFSGRTALEVITKHQREAITPPDVVVRNVPRTLSAILLKMVAKRPENRYQTMDEVIRALEDFLGVSGSGPFTPKEEHAKLLQFAVERFNSSARAILRSQLIRGFFAACALTVASLGWWGHPLWAASALGFGVLTTIIYQVVIGLTQRSHLFVKFRQLVFAGSIADWLSWLAIGALAVMLLIVFGWLWPWIGAAVAASLVAMGFYCIIDVPLGRDRNVPLTQTETMLRQMRLRGLDEMALRQFVCKYSGHRWEEFYEALFGYEAKLQARKLWGQGERGRDRKKHAGWRDPIIRWIEHKQLLRHEAYERNMLQKIEARALAAKGISDAIAQKQARKNAQKVLEGAAKLRDTAARRAAMTAAPTTAPTAGPAAAQTVIKVIPPDWVQDASKTADEKSRHEAEPFERERSSWFQRRFGTPLDFALGAHVRFILAVLILSGFGLWWQQNKGREAIEQGAQIIASKREIVDVTARDFVGNVKDAARDTARNVAQGIQKTSELTTTKTLELPLIPLSIREMLSGWNAALAGAILLSSVFCVGRIMGATVLVAAAIALLGHHFNLPLAGAVPSWISALVAAILGLFGMVVMRRPEGY